MAKNRADRFSSAGELAIALSAVASGATGDEAIRTATISATRIQAAKTQMVAGKTHVGVGKTAKGSISPLAFILPVIALVGIAVVAIGAYLIFGNWKSNLTPTSTVPALLVVPTVAPVETATKTLPTHTPELPTPTQTSIPPTETLAPPTETLKQAAKAIGGVDKVAFVANNEIWVMNIDGTDLKQITNDRFMKTDLQWIPGTDNEIVYISGKNIGIVNAETSDG